MKRIIEILPMLAVLLFVTACSNDTIEKKQEQPEGNTVKIPFTATVNDLTTTRATLDGSKEYIFEVGDKLYVEGTGVYGILTLADGEAGKKTGAKFSGALTCSGTPSADLALTATLVSTTDAIHTISGEKVTATSYGTAIVFSEEQAVQKFSHFTGSATYGTPSFTLNQQSAFVSFDITLKDGTASSSSVAVSISNGGAEVRSGSIKTVTADGDVKARFVAAFPGGSTTLDNATVTLDARTPISFGGSTALAKNKIYTVTKGLIDISTLASAYTAQNGDLLFGTGDQDTHISIADGATVIFHGINITDVSNDKNWSGVTCLGSANIVLSGTNTVWGYNTFYPGIYVPRGKTLTISGDGTLNASSTQYTGGVASPGGNAAGIGAGPGKTSDLGGCGTIRILSGTIVAIGGYQSAGIGGSQGNEPATSCTCDGIEILGGSVTATGGGGAAGIGGGRNYYGRCKGDIVISGGTVIAQGGNNGAGIGSGIGHDEEPESPVYGNIIITGGTVTATGGNSGAGIGTGYQGRCGNIIIRGGTVTATGGKNISAQVIPAGIGCGEGDYGDSEKTICGDIIITNGVTKVIAAKYAKDDVSWCVGKCTSFKSICGTIRVCCTYNEGTGTYEGGYTNADGFGDNCKSWNYIPPADPS